MKADFDRIADIDSKWLNTKFSPMRELRLVAVLFYLSSCSSLCSDETVKLIVSPKGDHQARLFMRECGATTDFTTQISIDPSIWQVAGNAFVADAYNGGKRGTWGGPWADIAWVSPNHLMVTYDQRSRIFDKHYVVNGVEITYRPVAN